MSYFIRILWAVGLQVTQLILHRDEAGESKRFAFVTFADKESTNACLEKLEGLEVAGKALAVRVLNVFKVLDMFARRSSSQRCN